MGAFISRQPNGLYCRFSTITDCPTHWNMTRDDYIKIKVDEAIEKATKEAIDVLENYLYPFDDVIERFYPNNMTKEEFDEFLEDTSGETCENCVYSQLGYFTKERIYCSIKELNRLVEVKFEDKCEKFEKKN